MSHSLPRVFSAGTMAFPSCHYYPIHPKYSSSVVKETNVGRHFFGMTKRSKSSGEYQSGKIVLAASDEAYTTFESSMPPQKLHLNHLTDSEDAILSALMGDFNLAPASQIAYFYLHKTIGLSEEVMWKITLERSSILGLTTANLEEKVNLLRSEMSLSDEDLRVILKKQPSVLALSAQNLASTVVFLVKELQLNKSQVRSIILQYPSILTYSLQNIKQKINFFIEDVGFSICQTRELLLRTPQLLTLSVDNHLKQKYSFFRQEIQMSKEAVQRLMQKHPDIFATHSLENNVKLKLIGLFTQKLLFEPIHLSKMLHLYPQILDRSLNEYLMPFTQYFLQNLMFSPLELRTILTQFPRLSSYSLARIKHIAAYLQDEEGFTAEQVKRIFFQAPQIVCLKEEHLKEKIKFICNALELHPTDDDRLRKIIAGMPSLLKCSLKGNLLPKIEYLLRAFHNSLDDLREAILLQPTLLGYSLEKRIRPRMEKIILCGLPPKKITIAITLRDDRFQSWLLSQKMSPDEKKVFRQQQRSFSARHDGVGETTPMYGKQIVDKEGRIILWSRPSTII